MESEDKESEQEFDSEDDQTEYELLYENFQ